MRIQGMFEIFCLCLVCGAGSSHADIFANTAVADEARLLVLTDIAGDPDDQQSMARLMLYANEFEIEGLVVSASGTPGELKEAVTKPQLICEIVDAYGQIRDNLALHADGYPTGEHLRARIKSGNPKRGFAAIGDGHNTEGSRWIISTVDREDPRPVNIAIWGGQSDLAQALWRVPADRDADRLAYRWWIYSEAGTYPAQPALTATDTAELAITFPLNAVGNLHVILEVTDAGQPPLTTYRRVVVTTN